jgi:hypothetical protein
MSAGKALTPPIMTRAIFQRPSKSQSPIGPETFPDHLVFWGFRIRKLPLTARQAIRVDIDA